MKVYRDPRDPEDARIPGESILGFSAAG